MLVLPDAGSVSVMDRSTRGTDLVSPSTGRLLEPGGSGQDAVRTRRPRAGGELLGRFAIAGREAMRKVCGRTHGEAAGTKSGYSFVERITVKTGTTRLQFQAVGIQPAGRDRCIDH